MEPTYETIRVGSRWALVTNYANLAGGTGRQGWWCEDISGGWGTSRRGAGDAVTHCVRPMLYATKQAALETIGRKQFAAQGGRASAAALTADERREKATRAAQVRWATLKGQ